MIAWIKKYRWVLWIICAYVIRVAGNVLYDIKKLAGNPNAAEYYYISDAVFEVMAVFGIYRLTRHVHPYLAVLQNMFLGLVIFFLIKVCFLNRTDFQYSDWWNIGFAASFGLYEIYRTWKNSTK